MEKIAVIVPTFNRKEVTIKCISKLLSQSLKAHIVVCDSDSNDGTRDSLPRTDDITVLNVGHDAWWSEAVNTGIKWALTHGYKKIILINDDIGFGNTLIEDLNNAAKNHLNAIITPSQLNSNFKYSFLGFIFSGITKKKVLISSPPNTDDIFVDASNGCCLFIPGSILLKVGNIDQKKCPHLFGDIEFLLRVKNAGFKLVATPKIQITQEGNTDYRVRVRLRDIFTNKGSPYHFKSYIKFGETLFKGKVKFLILGIHHHLLFIKSLYEIAIYKINSRLNK
jgi:GT2 family glycosyltransferase